MNNVEIIEKLYDLGFDRYTIEGTMSGCTVRLWRRGEYVAAYSLEGLFVDPALSLEQAYHLVTQKLGVAND